MSLFVVHLYDVHGLRDSQRVAAVLSGLRLIWRVHGLDSRFFDESNRNAEVRKAETRKLPAVVEILAAMRERLWVDTAWDAEGSYRKAIWIAALTGFDTGVRPSNVRLKEGKSAVDHCILASDLVFIVATTMGVRRLQGGEAIRKELEDGYPESIQRVSDVDISVMTTKSTNKSSAGRVVYRVSRGNAFESSAVDDSACSRCSAECM